MEKMDCGVQFDDERVKLRFRVSSLGGLFFVERVEGTRLRAIDASLPTLKVAGTMAVAVGHDPELLRGRSAKAIVDLAAKLNVVGGEFTNLWIA